MMTPPRPVAAESRAIVKEPLPPLMKSPRDDQLLTTWSGVTPALRHDRSPPNPVVVDQHSYHISEPHVTCELSHTVIPISTEASVMPNVSVAPSILKTSHEIQPALDETLDNRERPTFVHHVSIPTSMNRDSVPVATTIR